VAVLSYSFVMFPLLNTQNVERWYYPALLTLAVCLVYANSLEGIFVHDDLPSIVANEDVRSIVHPSMWGTWSSSPHSSIDARPLVRLSLALNFAWGGLEVRSYHLVNIALHCGCGLLLYGLLRLSTERATAAFFVSLLWLVHPLNSECVNYIVVRTESLMVLFYLATLYCAARGWAVAAVCCSLLGMACKESMVSVPLVVLLYDRTFVASSLGAALRRRPMLYIGLAATWIPLAVLIFQGGRGDSAGFAREVGVWQYALNQCWVLVDYLQKVFWPYALNIDYGYPLEMRWVAVWPEALFVLVLLCMAMWSWLHCRQVGFAALLFFIALAPTSSIVPILTEVGAERRMYLPLAALMSLGGMGGDYLLQRLRCGWRWSVGAVLVIVLVLASVTMQRNGDYRSSSAIWQSAIEADPSNPRAHNNLALALEGEGQLDMALVHYKRALAGNDAAAEVHNNMGGVLLQLGRVVEAVAHLRHAVEIRPDYFEAQYNLGVALLRAGEPSAANEYLQKVLRVSPDFFAARLQTGRALVASGQSAAALAHLRRAVEIRPQDITARMELARVLLQVGRYDEAVVQGEWVLTVAPERKEARKLLRVARKNAQRKH
jgi:Tfp pilus assembly protein PilF